MRVGSLANGGVAHAGSEADRNRFTDVGADLKGCGTKAAIQQFLAVEGGLRGNPVDFRKSLLYFSI